MNYNKFDKHIKSEPIKITLPHNFFAEKMILSCIIVNSETISIVSNHLPINSFYFKNHQELYKSLLYMNNNQLSIDIVTLVTFLQNNGLLKKIGGIKVLIQLINQIPNLTYLEKYIQLVKEKFLRRSFIKLGYEIINSGYITNIPLETILNNFESSLFNLTNQLKKQKVYTSSDLITSIFLDIKRKFLKPSLPGLISGFENLDLLTQGFQKSDLIIIAGRPSVGKTAFSLNIALNILKNSRLPILFISLEMSKEQIMYRLLSIETNINQLRLKNGNLYQTDWIKLNKIMKIFSKLPLFIDDTTNFSLQDLKHKIKTLFFEQTKLGLIIIDYLQLIKYSTSKTENRVQELAQITRTLKNFAQEFNVPIIALSQLSRNIENRLDQRPVLSDLRDSGSIEQDADLVLFLKKSNNLKINNKSIKIIELILAKHRNGPTGTIKLQFETKQIKFKNI